MRLVTLPEASLGTKLHHQVLNLLPKICTMHMQQCLKNDKDDFG